MSILPFFKVALIIFLALVITSCGVSTPREEFRDQLEEKVESLLKKIRYLGSGEKEEVEVTMSYGSKSRESTMMILKSSGIKDTAISINKMFEKVSIALLSQDIEGFDIWGEDLKNDIGFYRQKISEATDRLAKRTQKESFTVSQSLIASFIDKASEVEFSDKGELYILVGSSQSRAKFFPKKTLTLDIDKWLASIKQSSLTFQKNKDTP